jgi:hypothetical protein
MRVKPRGVGHFVDVIDGLNPGRKWAAPEVHSEALKVNEGSVPQNRLQNGASSYNSNYRFLSITDKATLIKA